MTWDAFFSYGTLLLATFVTLAALVKDAKDYLETSRSHGKILLWIVYICVVLLFVAGVVQTHINRKQAASDRQQAEMDRLNLSTDREKSKLADAASQARLTDAAISLQKLQDKVDHLQTQAQTQKLSRDLNDVTRELEDAKAKLQKPLAKFEATFATPYYDKIPILEKVGERTPEGIKVSFGVYNNSYVAASKGEIVIRLCDACQFGIEPEGFTKPKVGPEDERVRGFDTILEHAVFQDLTITIIPPLTGEPQQLVFGVLVKCENCEPAKFSRLFVTVPPVLPPDFGAKKKTLKSKP